MSKHYLLMPSEVLSEEIHEGAWHLPMGSEHQLTFTAHSWSWEQQSLSGGIKCSQVLRPSRRPSALLLSPLVVITGFVTSLHTAV